MTCKDSKAARLKQSQLLRAKELSAIDTTDPDTVLPRGAVLADQSKLIHNNTYARLPRFYLDQVVVCRQCGTEEVWPAKRQKWWFETAKGNINTKAVLCKACREKVKIRKAEARRIDQAGLEKKRKKNET